MERNPATLPQKLESTFWMLASVGAVSAAVSFSSDVWRGEQERRSKGADSVMRQEADIVCRDTTTGQVVAQDMSGKSKQDIISAYRTPGCSFAPK